MKKLTANTGGDVGKRETHFLLVGLHTSQPLWKSVWRVFQRLKINLPYDPSTPPFGICPNDSMAYFAAMFIEALFTIARKWKQLKCLPTNG